MQNRVSVGDVLNQLKGIDPNASVLVVLPDTKADGEHIVRDEFMLIKAWGTLRRYKTRSGAWL